MVPNPSVDKNQRSDPSDAPGKSNFPDKELKEEKQEGEFRDVRENAKNGDDEDGSQAGQEGTARAGT